jgi:hypothetical protein
MAKTRKAPKVEESSLIDQLSKPLRDIVADIKDHGVSTFQRLREENPSKYIEDSIKFIALIATLKTAPVGISFETANSMEQIGQRLLQSVGHAEDEITPDMIEQALALNNTFIAGLEAIRAKAEGEIH